jgi:hypothetical protein
LESSLLSLLLGQESTSSSAKGQHLDQREVSVTGGRHQETWECRWFKHWFEWNPGGLLSHYCCPWSRHEISTRSGLRMVHYGDGALRWKRRVLEVE